MVFRSIDVEEFRKDGVQVGLRLISRSLLGAFAGFWILGAATFVRAAGEGEIYVDLRASESPGAPVIERQRLYGTSHALVIGIDNYTNGWPRLSSAVKDARMVAEALEARGFQVELLVDTDGQRLRRELRRFFAVKGSDPEARLFVWFAGHGYTESGEGYLVPADAPLPGGPEFLLTALHMGDVGSMVRIAKAKHVLAVFDSCFAGTIFTAQRARAPAAITQAVKRPVRQFLTSGDADQLVSDDGTFRTLFLRALQGEETADANRDGYLTGSELSLYLEDRITNLTQGAQTPRSGKLRDPRFDQGDFVFLLPTARPKRAPTSQSAASTPSGPGAVALELAFWNSIKETDRAEDYSAYLEAFPDGSFAPLARVRIGRMGAKASAKQSQAAVQDTGPSPNSEGVAPGSQSARVDPQRPSREEAKRRLSEAIRADYDGARRAFYRHIRQHSAVDGRSRRVVDLAVIEVAEVREDGWVVELDYYVTVRGASSAMMRRHQGRFFVRLTDDGVEFLKAP